MATQIVESIMQFASGPQRSWENILIPIPAGIMIYAADTRVVKISDGVTIYKDLPIAFDFDDVNSAGKFVQMYPHIDISDADKLIFVNAETTEYEVSDFTFTSIVPIADGQSAVDQLADIGHGHEEVATLADVESNIGRASSTDQDILSFLALRDMSLNDALAFAMNTNYIDDFFNADYIESFTAGAHAASKLVGETGLDVTSININSESLISMVRVFLHCTEGVSLSVSRDGGTNWTPVTLTETPMSGTAKMYAGSCAFGSNPDGQVLKYRLTGPAGSEVHGMRINW